MEKFDPRGEAKSLGATLSTRTKKDEGARCSPRPLGSR
jgi:hypothetical protein